MAHSRSHTTAEVEAHRIQTVKGVGFGVYHGCLQDGGGVVSAVRVEGSGNS